MIMRNFFKLLILIQGIIFISGFSFWAKLYFYPNTWSFKMLCPTSVEIKLDHQWSESYGTRLDTIFNPLEILDTNISFSRSGFYNTIVQSDIWDSPTRLITSAYNNPITNRISWDNVSLWNFNFETHSVNTTWTRFEIYANTLDSADFSNDSSVMLNPTTDILSETWYGYYTFSPWTCDPDIEYPENTQSVLDINNSDRIKYLFWFDFFVRDGSGYTKDQPGYKTDNVILQDYYYGKNQANRESGIDPYSMTIEFIYSDWSKISFTWSNPWINLAWTGKTRDRKRRDYWISVSPFGLVDFGIEKTMEFSGKISDYAWHQTTIFYTFNNPTPPRIAYMSPNTWEKHILPKTDIVLKLSDNRAWIDPNSVQVEVYSWWCNGSMIWQFSGDSLYKEAVSWYANTPDYMIKISSWSVYNWQEFVLPTNETEICIKVSAEDNENNQIISPNNEYSFTTRNQCSFYDCENMFEIYRSPDAITWQIYSLPKLYITWGQNPYIVWDTLYCWLLWNITLITGNIQNPTNFKQKTLQVSWWFISLSGEVMTITPFIVNN